MSFFRATVHQNIQSMTPRDQRRRKLTIVFWVAQTLLFGAALTIRLASPSVAIPPLQTAAHVGLFSPSNICSVVNDHLMAISHTSVADLSALNTRVANLDTYLQSVLYHIPRDRNTVFTAEFVENVHALKNVCERWKLQKTINVAAADLQADALSYCSKFRDLLHNFSKPAPRWYLHIARTSTGFLEGLGTPAFLLWRTASCALKGQFTVKSILHPRDWRRAGPFFFAAMFYGSILCAYLFAWLALNLKHAPLSAPGLIALLYSMGHIFFYILV